MIFPYDLFMQTDSLVSPERFMTKNNMFSDQIFCYQLPNVAPTQIGWDLQSARQ